MPITCREGTIEAVAGLKVFRWWGNHPDGRCQGVWLSVAAANAKEATRLFKQVGARPISARTIELTRHDPWVAEALSEPGTVFAWEATDDAPWERVQPTS